MKRISLLIFVLALAFTALLITGCNEGETPSETQSDTQPTQSDTQAPTEEPDEGPYIFRTEKLGKYTIVFDSDNSEYARLASQLKRHISQRYGESLTIKRDKDLEPSRYEILIGDTDRYEPCGRIMEYSVRVDGCRFIINTGGAYSAEKAIDELCKTVFNGGEVELSDGEYYKKSLLPEITDAAEGRSARLMSANILADSFADEKWNNANYRAELFAGVLVTYTPDAIGVQEADGNWDKALDAYIEIIKREYGIEYTRLLDSYEDKLNYTSLIYRSDRFKVEDSGVKVFGWWTDSAFNHGYHMRNISWAELCSLEGEDRFVIADTHWSYRTEHSGGNVTLSGGTKPIEANELRTQCKDETNAFLAQLRESKPDTPIFALGDFNTSLVFFTQYGWLAEGFGVLSEEAKTAGTASSEVPDSGHYDHIFGTGDYFVAHFELIGGTDTHKLLSDHSFACADVILSK